MRWPPWNSASCLVLRHWLVKATTRTVAHWVSSVLFVVEWSWQQARAGSGFQHTPCQSTYCFCSWHWVPVHPNYNSITESCDRHTFHHLGGPGRAGLLWRGCSVPLFSLYSSSLRNLVGPVRCWVFAVPNLGCTGWRLCMSRRLWHCDYCLLYDTDFCSISDIKVGTYYQVLPSLREPRCLHEPLPFLDAHGWFSVIWWNYRVHFTHCITQTFDSSIASFFSLRKVIGLNNILFCTNAMKYPDRWHIFKVPTNLV